MRSRSRRWRAPCAAALLMLAGVGCGGEKTHNLILITLDGVRIQEIFSGMDPVLAAHSATFEYSEIESGRARYWRESPEERREALMPFFWKTLAPMGVVLGNKAAGSSVTVQNAVRWSSAGYAELLTGAPRAEIVDNTLVRHPYRTFMEFARSELDLDASEVAQFGSWDGIKFAASSRDDAFLMNGAFDPIPAALSNPDMDRLVALRHRMLGLWEESGNDGLTFELALAYLRQHEPRLLWIAFGQSDDWGHADRYDRLLEYLHLIDGMLDELWNTLQSMDAYRDRTTLILTTDHGRGVTAQTWAEHDVTIPGSEDIWVAVIGPDTPDRGELAPAPAAHQGDIAATALQLLGLDARAFSAEAGPPIPGTMD
ncbi:MAG: alkaline phosphatase family protein [Myxococcales bacterium]|nr:alkaline phosphatase family protein [Myxococcales bacterium]